LNDQPCLGKSAVVLLALVATLFLTRLHAANNVVFGGLREAVNRDKPSGQTKKSGRTGRRMDRHDRLQRHHTNGLDGWTIDESGGSAAGQGSVSSIRSGNDRFRLRATAVS
jgi:hypothetical protein